MRERGAATPVQRQLSLLTEDDIYLFNEGSHYRLYEKLGAHLTTSEGVAGTYFAVWAPNAEAVYVMGDFNGWNNSSHPLHPKGESGIWEGFIPGLGQWTNYKYHIVSRLNNYRVDKADPFGFHHETPPRTGSIVTSMDYDWNDGQWMAAQQQHNSREAPMSV